METVDNQVKKKKYYTEAQKAAIKKYRQKNKDKINELQRKYYVTNKNNDPNYLVRKREKSKEYYLKSKNKSELVNP